MGEIFGAVLGASIAIILLVLVVVVALWVVNSVACMRVLKAEGYPWLWMAWIPYFNSFALADITREDAQLIPGVNFTIPFSVFRFWWILSFVLPHIPNVGDTLNTIWSILCWAWVYRVIFSRISGKEIKDETIWGFAAAFIPFIAIARFLSIPKYD